MHPPLSKTPQPSHSATPGALLPSLSKTYRVPSPDFNRDKLRHRSRGIWGRDAHALSSPPSGETEGRVADPGDQVVLRRPGLLCDPSFGRDRGQRRRPRRLSRPTTPGAKRKTAAATKSASDARSQTLRTRLTQHPPEAADSAPGESPATAPAHSTRCKSRAESQSRT